MPDIKYFTFILPGKTIYADKRMCDRLQLVLLSRYPNIVCNMNKLVKQQVSLIDPAATISIESAIQMKIFP